MPFSLVIGWMLWAGYIWSGPSGESDIGPYSYTQVSSVKNKLHCTEYMFLQTQTPERAKLIGSLSTKARPSYMIQWLLEPAVSTVLNGVEIRPVIYSRMPQLLN